MLNYRPSILAASIVTLAIDLTLKNSELFVKLKPNDLEKLLEEDIYQIINKSKSVGLDNGQMTRFEVGQQSSPLIQDTDVFKVSSILPELLNIWKEHPALKRLLSVDQN